MSTQDPRAGLPSASSIDRYAHCPGSWHAEQGLPPLPTTSVTSDGTDIHAAMETGEDDGLDEPQKEIADKLRKMEADEVSSFIQHYGIEEAPVVFREHRVWIRNRTNLNPITSAQLDVGYQFLQSGYGAVYDYKTGYKGATPSELSWQSRTQVLGFWYENFGETVKVIRGGFLASRLSSKCDVTDYTIEHIRAIERELNHILWRINQSNQPRVPGAHCRYCRAQGQCREAATYAMVVQNGLPASTKADPLALVNAVQRLTPGELAFIHSRKALAESIFEMVDARLRSLSKEELAALGLKLGAPCKTYPIESEQMPEIDAQLKAMGLTEAERLSCYKLTRSRVDGLVAEKRNMSKKDATEIVIKTLGLVAKEGKQPINQL